MAKIGALLGYGPATDIDSAFSKFQSLGLNCCQLSVWDVENMFTPEKAVEAKAASAKYGIEITALWAGWTGPAAWNFTEGPATLGIVPAEYDFTVPALFSLFKGSVGDIGFFSVS